MANDELALRSSNEAVLRPRYPASQRLQRETITIRNARIIYRNFSGAPGQYNAEGDRNFSVLLDGGLAQDLLDKGWNVKPVKRHDEDEEQMFHLPVAVSYRIRPPRVYMVTGDGNVMPLRKTLLSEELVHMMDNLELGDVHMVLAAFNYEIRGTKGKKAYLQSFFGHVLLDELEQEYATVEDMIEVDTETHRDEDNVIEGEVVY